MKSKLGHIRHVARERAGFVFVCGAQSVVWGGVGRHAQSSTASRGLNWRPPPCCLQVEKWIVSRIFASPELAVPVLLSHVSLGAVPFSSCVSWGLFIWLQVRYGWVVTEVMNMVENCWFNDSNNMLYKARGGLGKGPKGESQITSFLITDIRFHSTL